MKYQGKERNEINKNENNIKQNKTKQNRNGFLFPICHEFFFQQIIKV